jgi:hypothetical protein
MFLGHLVFAWNVWKMTYGKAAAEAPEAALAAAAE